MPSEGKWRPELHLAVNAGSARMVSPTGFHSIALWLPFLDFFGPAATISGGVAKLKELSADKARVLRLLISAKAYQTQPYSWSSNNGECGSRDLRLFAIGPKVTYGSQKWLSEHVGLEWQAGLGCRLGAWQQQVFSHGDLDYSCSSYNVVENLPDSGFQPARFQVSPTIHLGLSLVFQ